MRFLVDGLEVFFPYDLVYREQYQYMLELKRALDAKGDAILEMPTGTGKTVCLLSLITSYQFAHPECGKLIYCTRTVPEMVKTIDELKRIIEYRRSALGGTTAIAPNSSAALSLGGRSELTSGGSGTGDILAVCLSSRRNMCIHPDVSRESDKEAADAGCRAMTASWVRAKAAAEPGEGIKTCDFFEGWERNSADDELRGIYNLEDIKALGIKKGWCPYFAARRVISYANVVVYNYQVRYATICRASLPGSRSESRQAPATTTTTQAHNSPLDIVAATDLSHCSTCSILKLHRWYPKNLRIRAL